MVPKHKKTVYAAVNVVCIFS